MSALTAIITAEDHGIRNQALDAFCESGVSRTIARGMRLP